MPQINKINISNVSDKTILQCHKDADHYGHTYWANEQMIYICIHRESKEEISLIS
jgi:hypothetical protein